MQKKNGEAYVVTVEMYNNKIESLDYIISECNTIVNQEFTIIDYLIENGAENKGIIVKIKKVIHTIIEKMKKIRKAISDAIKRAFNAIKNKIKNAKRSDKIITYIELPKLDFNKLSDDIYNFDASIRVNNYKYNYDTLQHEYTDYESFDTYENKKASEILDILEEDRKYAENQINKFDKIYNDCIEMMKHLADNNFEMAMSTLDNNNISDDEKDELYKDCINFGKSIREKEKAFTALQEQYQSIIKIYLNKLQQKINYVMEFSSDKS